MRYVIVDDTGSSRANFDDVDALLAVIDELSRDDAEMLEEIAVLRYDDAGDRVGAPIEGKALLTKSAAELSVGISVSVNEADGLAENYRPATGSAGARPAAIA